MSKQNKGKLGGLGRMMGYLGKHKVRLFFVILFAIVSTIFTVLAPMVMGLITTELFDGASSGAFDWQRIVTLLVVLAALYIVAQLFAYLQNVGMTHVSASVLRGLRDDIDQKMHRLPLNYYDTKTNGEILSVITNDMDTVSNMISQSLAQMVSQVVTAVGILIVMLSTNGWLTLIAVAMVPLSLLSALGVMKASTKHYGQQQELIGEMNGCIEEIYNGNAVIKAFGREGQAKTTFDDINGRLQATAEKADTESGLISPITSLVNNLGYVVSAVLGCFFVIGGGMTVGGVQAMLQYTKQFSQPFTSIAGMAGSIGAASAAATRIFELLDAPEQEADVAVSQPTTTAGGEVTFSHVKFGYDPTRPLMTDVSFTARPSQKIAIVGPTGAGKTTLVNLLMRFYEIDGGHIYVDGVDTRQMTREDLRRHFSMVLQDTWLFEGTIGDNLAYGRENLTKEEVLAASKAASADDFVRTLPDGYDFMLSHSGENVSQGERQLLTIARAMACDPEIMILDEATSSVDTYTEQRIQDAMAQLLRGRTSFVIAHRLSTIRDADMILYMENGDIKEAGSHDELMAKHGKYEALYMSQFA
jgi:ATP-binding cassette subfamily B protein